MADAKSSFETVNGLITFKRRIVAYQQNPKLLLILTVARQGFTANDHAAFDALVYKTGEGIERRYVDSFEDFFDPKKRYEAFLGGDKLEGYGITFTAQELALADTIKSVKTKIEAAFKMPEAPYVNAAAIDVVKIYGTQAPRAQLWLADDSTVTSDDYYLRRIAAAKPSTNNLLRVHTTKSGAVHIQNLTQHKMAESVAKRLWRKLRPVWLAESYPSGHSGENYSRAAGYHGDREIRVYKTYVSIGCQTIPRAEIERIAALRGWDKAPA